MAISYLVDNSMNFEDFAELKVGDIFYETGYGVVLRAEVVSGVVIGTGHEGRPTVSFSADVTDAKRTGDDVDKSRVDYLKTKGLMHYGDSCYRTLIKWDTEAQKEIE